MPPIDPNTLFRLVLIVIVGGLIMLAATFFLTPLLPLIALGVVLGIAYFVYKWLTAAPK
ncbi:MAG TPA: hypothetical protein VJC10_03135 [Patescibacteria group bacterium]|nr:hypothetical protein [Patescibacteria group bacterium]